MGDWKNTISMNSSMCKVARCNATSCKFNKNRNCTLGTIHMSRNGNCEEYTGGD